MHRGAEAAEHPLMGNHVGKLIGHMVFHKVVFARQFRKLRAFSSADSVQKRVSSSAPRQSSGQSFRPSARKRPSARRNAPLDARRQAYLTFAFSRLVIFSIRLSSNYQNIQKGRPRI